MCSHFLPALIHRSSLTVACHCVWTLRLDTRMPIPALQPVPQRLQADSPMTPTSSPAIFRVQIKDLRHTRDHLLPEANVTEARLSDTSADRTAPSSAGNVYDVFTLYETEFGRIQTIRDAQKPRLSFTPERRCGVAAGGSA
jgi:hypothetical protein